MSTHRKVDPEAGARFLIDLLAEDEAERLDSLTDEEYLAERKAKGLKPLPAPPTEELLARLQARAQRKLAPEASGPRVAQATDATAPVDRVAPRPRTRRVVFALAATLVVAIFVAAVEGPAIVAAFRGNHLHEDIEPESPPAQQVAGRLRHDASGLCEQGAWTSCVEKLDQAKRLDPGGESDPEVQRLRSDIDRAAHPPQDLKPNKPSP